MNVQATVDQIRSLELDHVRFHDLDRRLFAHATFAMPGDVIVVTGPTRVGKTTLKNNLIPKLFRAHSAEDGSIPVVDVEAATTQQGRISTKHFTLRLLEELHDPIYCGPDMHIRRSQAETELRIQVERTMKYRGTKFVLLDEAHHFLRAPKTMSAADLLDWLKCLGNRTGAVVILFGGYDLLRFCFDSGHLNGRSLVLDFARYQSIGSDLDEFDRILLTLDELLGPASEGTLFSLRDLIYNGSLGCIGLITSWIIKALADMFSLGNPVLCRRNFERTRMPHQLARIREEIEYGEDVLGLHPSDWDVPGHQGAVDRERGTRPRGPKPFTRRPHRDVVQRA